MTDNRARLSLGRPESDEQSMPATDRRMRSPAPVPAKRLLAEFPGDDMTPQMRSAVMKLMDELDRLEGELTAANARVSQLEDMADEDPLVPLLNRRGFERELERTLAYVQRHGTTVTLVYLDLDDFKVVNDRYGHAGGDAALKHFANMLLEDIRKSDLAGRLGGDEFAVVLHHADPAAALDKASRMAGRLACEPAMHGNIQIPLTATYGATLLRGDDTVTSVLERADKAMYEGKARRRAQR
jgi:diguanylate cyclase (GGDEF)-like protein